MISPIVDWAILSNWVGPDLWCLKTTLSVLEVLLSNVLSNVFYSDNIKEQFIMAGTEDGGRYCHHGHSVTMAGGIPVQIVHPYQLGGRRSHKTCLSPDCQ